VFVIVDENEPFEKALKKFKRLVEKEGILTEVRRRQYEKPSEKKKRRERQARKRILKAMKKRNML